MPKSKRLLICSNKTSTTSLRKLPSGLNLRIRQKLLSNRKRLRTCWPLRKTKYLLVIAKPNWSLSTKKYKPLLSLSRGERRNRLSSKRSWKRKMTLMNRPPKSMRNWSSSWTRKLRLVILLWISWIMPVSQMSSKRDWTMETTLELIGRSQETTQAYLEKGTKDWQNDWDGLYCFIYNCKTY